jgi:hypothetical protein
MEEDKSNLYNEIVYYFKETGLLIHGEYKLKKDHLSYENILQKYYKFLNDKEIQPLIKSKINHQICFHYYKNLKEENKFKLTINLDNLKINYYNFILICNLVHYYNKYYETNTKDVLFLLELMKKFSIIIFKGEGIKDTKDGLILILLFLYYYSILAIHLYKNTQYIDFKDNEYEPTSSFFDFIQNRVNTLFADYFQDPIYQKHENIFNNDFINLNIDSLRNYLERKNDTKLIFFIKFIKFILFLMKNDENQHNFDYSMIQYSDINLNIRINLFLRKAFYDIINVYANNIKKSLEDLKKIKNNFLINNENTDIEYFYYKQIIQSNSNLLSFSKTNIDINKEKIEKIKKINTTHLSGISKKYHEYNIKVLEYVELKEKEEMLNKKKEENENNNEERKKYNKEIKNIKEEINVKNAEIEINKEEMSNNIFFMIICTYNDIILMTKEYKNKDPIKGNDRCSICEEIFRKVESFCSDLENIEDEDKINFIKNNNYLKILISRIFYNYFILKIIRKKNKIINEFFEDKSFENIINKFSIKNFLVDKIRADIFFISNDDKNISEAKINYAIINNNTYNGSLSSLFGYAFCSNESNPEKKKKYDIACINVLDLIISKLKNHHLKFDVEKLKDLNKKNS